MFPDPDQLGVDLIIPDLTYVEARRDQVKALILTHGHEDHIGAVPHVLDRFDGPVYGTAMTLALIEPKLEEHGIDARDRLKIVKPRDTITVGPLNVEFIRVTHSMPDCVALAIGTPAGVVVHTGDFKIDQTPIDGQYFDLHRFAELGQRGVLALFADSTNVDRRGFTGPEIEVIEAFEEIFTSTEGKLVVAAFATNAAPANAEWIELANATAGNLNISTFKLGDVNAKELDVGRILAAWILVRRLSLLTPPPISTRKRAATMRTGLKKSGVAATWPRTTDSVLTSARLIATPTPTFAPTSACKGRSGIAALTNGPIRSATSRSVTTSLTSR